jgi:hypothetical protein
MNSRGCCTATKRTLLSTLTPSADGSDDNDNAMLPCERIGCTNWIHYRRGVDANDVCERVIGNGFYCSTSCLYTAFYLRHGECTALAALRERLCAHFGRPPRLLSVEQPCATVTTTTTESAPQDSMEHDGADM